MMQLVGISTVDLTNKIQNIDPDNAMKVIGYLLLNYTDEKVVQLANGPVIQIVPLIDEAKAYLALPRNVDLASPTLSLIGEQLMYLLSPQLLGNLFTFHCSHCCSFVSSSADFQ